MKKILPRPTPLLPHAVPPPLHGRQGQGGMRACVWVRALARAGAGITDNRAMPFCLSAPVHHELLIKKSRFIACVEPVSGREQAVLRVAQLKDMHPDIVHETFGDQKLWLLRSPPMEREAVQRLCLDIRRAGDTCAVVQTLQGGEVR